MFCKGKRNPQVKYLHFRLKKNIIASAKFKIKNYKKPSITEFRDISKYFAQLPLPIADRNQ